MPYVVDLGGREATPIPPERSSRSAARSHLAGVAGINRNRWPEWSGLGGRFRPEHALSAYHPYLQACDFVHHPGRSIPTYGRCLGVLLRRGWIGWETSSVSLDPSRRGETPTFRAAVERS